MSSSKLIDSLSGSRVMAPRSAIRACANIFWVLVLHRLLVKGLTETELADVLVEHKSAKYRQTTVERNCLRDGKTAKTKGEDHRCKRAQGDDGNTSKEGASHVQVLVVTDAERV